MPNIFGKDREHFRLMFKLLVDLIGRFMTLLFNIQEATTTVILSVEALSKQSLKGHSYHDIY